LYEILFLLTILGLRKAADDGAEEIDYWLRARRWSAGFFRGYSDNIGKNRARFQDTEVKE